MTGFGGPGTLLGRYGLPPEEIERRSLGIVEGATGLLPAEPQARRLLVRIMYAAGDLGLAPAVVIHPGACAAGSAALRSGAPIICDGGLTAAGVSPRLAARLGCLVLQAVDRPEVAEAAARSRLTRAAAAMALLSDRLNGALAVVGTSPTALLALLDLADAGVCRPALVVGMPVGFVAAAESKEELLARDIPFVTIRGTRGGSPLAAATVNTLLGFAAQGAEQP